MLKKTITYIDYNGLERTEDFYFNLTEAELTKMELNTDGSLTDKINRIVAAKDQRQIISLFEDIVIASYGKKSDDGRRFIKSQEAKEEFMENPAFSEIYMELATDENAATDFIAGIMPAKLQNEIKNNNLKEAAAEKLGIKAVK